MFGFFKKSKHDVSKNQVPPPEFIQKMDDKVRYTPDLWKLGQYKYRLYFAYGEEMDGHQNHHILQDDGTPMYTAFTRHTYSVWKRKLGIQSYPVAMEATTYNGWGAEPVRIKGELYRVRPERLVELDRMRLNGVQFLRKEVFVEIPYRILQRSVEQETFSRPVADSRTVKAFMYVGVPSYWNELLDAGFSFSPVRTYQGRRDWLKKYACFTTREYKDI